MIPELLLWRSVISIYFEERGALWHCCRRCEDRDQLKPGWETKMSWCRCKMPLQMHAAQRPQRRATNRSTHPQGTSSNKRPDQKHQKHPRREKRTASRWSRPLAAVQKWSIRSQHDPHECCALFSFPRPDNIERLLFILDPGGCILLCLQKFLRFLGKSLAMHVPPTKKQRSRWTRGSFFVVVGCFFFAVVVLLSWETAGGWMHPHKRLLSPPSWTNFTVSSK